MGTDRSCPDQAVELSSPALIEEPRRYSAPNRRLLVGPLRWSMGLTGAALWSLLIVASTLQPDSRGMGTHEQLGMPPCTFLFLTGIRCPSCGMTTSWAYLTHGRVGQAIQASASGSLLACISFVGGGFLLASALRGRWLWSSQSENAGAILAAAFGGLVLAEWLIRLAAA
jgi:hypothetical protein